MNLRSRVFPFCASRARASLPPGWIALLLAAVVAAQSLGFLHAVAHAGADPHASIAAHAREDAHGGWVEALFGLHDEASDCRLYDALGPQPFACAAAPVLPDLAPATAVLQSLDRDFVARRAALFEARGPPSFR